MHTVTMSNEKEKVYEYTEKTASEPPPNYDEAMAQAGYQQTNGPPTCPAFVQPTDYGAASSVTPMQPNIPQQQIIIIGGCPACRVGALEEHMTLLGILCGIFFFPFGLICCLTLTERKCTNCGAVFNS